jgi:hypothetical protein
MLDLAREYAALDVHQAGEVAAGRMCPTHHGQMPCDLCARFLPIVVKGRLITFDLASLTAEERRGARAIAALIAAAIERPPAAERLAEGDKPNDPDLGVPDVHP